MGDRVTCSNQTQTEGVTEIYLGLPHYNKRNMFHTPFPLNFRVCHALFFVRDSYVITNISFWGLT